MVRPLRQKDQTMTATETRTTTPTTTPAKNGTPAQKKDGTPRKTPQHRQLSPVERSTRAVMNLIGRLSPGDQRKTLAAVAALTAKSDEA